MDQAIVIDNLTKTYGKKRGVEGVSFSVERGDVFGFLGPNGAGKSTTIRTMLGFLKKDFGEIKILGRDSVESREELLKRIGYMPSETLFYPSMKVKDVIKFSANVRKMNCDKEAEKICERLKVDTEKRISELSLGNRKKVSIVCAMQHRPELFIFDEPTSGLDPLMQAEFFSLIEEYVREGATCMLSTHVLSEVKKHCKHVAIMKEGHLMCTGRVDELTHTNAKRIICEIDGEKRDYVFKGEVQELLKDLAGKKVTDLLIEEPSIDDIFMQYYEKKEEKKLC